MSCGESGAWTAPSWHAAEGFGAVGRSGRVATATATVVRGRVADRTVLLVASFGAFLAFLDATVVNVAFPNIRDSFPDSTISSLSGCKATTSDELRRG